MVEWKVIKHLIEIVAQECLFWRLGTYEGLSVGNLGLGALTSNT